MYDFQKMIYDSASVYVIYGFHTTSLVPSPICYQLSIPGLLQSRALIIPQTSVSVSVIPLPTWCQVPLGSVQFPRLLCW